MTDRAKGFLVHLDDDWRLGDGVVGADRILDAIRCIKGVVKVEPLVTDVNDVLARERIRREVYDRLRAVLDG